MKSLLVPLALLLGLPSAASAGAMPWEEPDLALKKSPTTLLELSRSTKFRRTAKKGPPCTVHPPNNVIDAWMAEQHVEIPELRGKWSGPLVRSDGSVRTEPGYDPATSMWCVGFDGPDVGSTWGDVCAAVGGRR